MTTVGYISPSTINIPSELDELLPKSLQVVASVLDVRAHSEEQFRAAREKLEGAAQALVADGAEAVVVDGVPVAVWDGYEAEREMWRAMQAKIGVPINSGVGAAVEGFRLLGVQRLVVATAYLPSINERLAGYLQQAGFEVLAIDGLAVHSPAEAGRLDPLAYAELVRHLIGASPQAEGVFIGGRGNLLSIAIDLERTLDRAVLTARQAGVWWLLRTLGIPFGYGRLLAAG
jgi:arylmalonate decarboxylase